MAKLPIKSNILFLAIAGILAVITSLVVGRVLDSKVNSTTHTTALATMPVVIAASEIVPGTTLDASQLVVAEWPRAAILNPDTLFSDLKPLIGRVVREPIHINEPITINRLAAEGSKGGLPVIIPAGMRAMTIAASEIVGVAGFIKPGDWVDVLATFTHGQGDQEQQITKTVLRRVQVLAIAQDMSQQPETITGSNDTTVAEAAQQQSGKAPDKSPAKTDKKEGGGLLGGNENTPPPSSAKIVTSVTLALLPHQVETLALSSEAGAIRLSLCPEHENILPEAKTAGASLNQLLGKPIDTRAVRSAPSPAPRSKPRPSSSAGQVEFWDSGQRSHVSF